MRLIVWPACLLMMVVSGHVQAQTWGCAGAYPDAGALSSFDTSYASHHNNNYISDMKNHYDSIQPSEIEPSCKEAVDQAFSCCMDLDRCGSYQGTFLANTGETSDVALRAQTVNASLESLNAGAAGTMLCQLKREDCSSTCDQNPSMVGNKKASSICKGIVISEHKGNLVSQQRLSSACTSLDGLNRATDGASTYSVVCSGSPTPCQLISN